MSNEGKGAIKLGEICAWFNSNARLREYVESRGIDYCKRHFSNAIKFFNDVKKEKGDSMWKDESLIIAFTNVLRLNLSYGKDVSIIGRKNNINEVWVTIYNAEIQYPGLIKLWAERVPGTVITPVVWSKNDARNFVKKTGRLPDYEDKFECSVEDLDEVMSRKGEYKEDDIYGIALVHRNVNNPDFRGGAMYRMQDLVSKVYKIDSYIKRKEKIYSVWAKYPMQMFIKTCLREYIKYQPIAEEMLELAPYNEDETPAGLLCATRDIKEVDDIEEVKEVKEVSASVVPEERVDFNAFFNLQ